jgi:hypothetical protein
MSNPNDPGGDDLAPVSSHGEKAASGATSAPLPKRSSPGALPDEKVKIQAKPELVGHTADGEPMLKLGATGDRRAPTQRGLDKAAIDAAVKEAKAQAAQRAAAGDVAPISGPHSGPRTSDADLALVQPARAPVWPWIVAVLLIGGAVAGVFALRSGALGESAPESASASATTTSAPPPPTPVPAASAPATASASAAASANPAPQPWRYPSSKSAAVPSGKKSGKSNVLLHVKQK